MGWCTEAVTFRRCGPWLMGEIGVRPSRKVYSLAVQHQPNRAIVPNGGSHKACKPHVPARMVTYVYGPFAPWDVLPGDLSSGVLA